MSTFDTVMEKNLIVPQFTSLLLHVDQGGVSGLQWQEMGREFSCVKNEYLSKMCVVGFGFLYCFFNSFEHTQILSYASTMFRQQWCFDPSSCCTALLWKVYLSASCLFFIYCQPVLDHIALEKEIYVNWNFTFISFVLFWVSVQVNI